MKSCHPAVMDCSSSYTLESDDSHGGGGDYSMTKDARRPSGLGSFRSSKLKVSVSALRVTFKL